MFYLKPKYQENEGVIKQPKTIPKDFKNRLKPSQDLSEASLKQITAFKLGQIFITMLIFKPMQSKKCIKKMK